MPDDIPNPTDLPRVRTRPERDAVRTRGLEPPSKRTPETEEMKRTAATRQTGQRIISGPLVRRAMIDSVRKLDPRWMVKSLVMFIVEIGSVLTTLVALMQLLITRGAILSAVIFNALIIIALIPLAMCGVACRAVPAAAFQIPRIAKAHGIPEAQVRDLVNRMTQGCTLGILGEPRVNVLKLNLVLDQVGK